jgi:CubicO group peptidase (beta-lactamase class C family)
MNLVKLDNQLPRSAPEAQGIRPASIQDFLEAAAELSLELHSFMLVRHGNVVAEAWWAPYGPARPHLLHSLSKSFTSTAIGLALAEGRLSLDAPVVSFFPEDAPAQVSSHLAAMQVRHLLSMSTGHDVDTTAFMHRRGDGNWIQAFFSVPVAYAPGTFFLYNSGATFMLSAIIQKVTGMRLLDYLQPRFLDPLGIREPRWEVSPQGINTGGWGMSVKTEDIVRFGQLYLQKGHWHGQQIVPEAWVAEASTSHISNGRNPASDWEQGYGYQFWRCRHNAYRGDGAFGQYCVVMPEQDAVVAITSSVNNMQTVLDLIWEHLLPAMDSPHPLTAQPEANAKVEHQVYNLALLPPTGAPSSPMAASVTGRTYMLQVNEMQMETVSFEFSDSACSVTCRGTQGVQRFTCGIGAWREDTFALPLHSPHVAASGVWTAPDTFVITLRYYETPSTYKMVCQFVENRLSVDIDIKFSLMPWNCLLTGSQM